MPTEGHTTVAEPHMMEAEPYTMAAEPHSMAAEPHTMAAEPHSMAAEPHSMAAEPHTMAAEPYTMVAERCYFSSSSLPEGHTKATRWLHDVVLRVRCVRTKSRRPRDGQEVLGLD